MFEWLTGRRTRATAASDLAARQGEQLREEGKVLLAAGDLAGAEHCFRQALAQDPRDAAAHQLLGSLAEKRADWKAAAQHHQSAFDLKPGLAMACLDACRALLLLGDKSSARTLLATGMALHPEHAEFHFYEGNILLSEGNADWARESYQRAFELGADHAALHGRMGAVMLTLCQPGKAREHLLRALEGDPGNLQVRQDLGATFTHLGEIDAAVSQQQFVIAHQPRGLGAHNCLLFTLCFTACTPQQYLAHAKRFAEQARVDAQRLALPLAARLQDAPAGQRRLRIGWVSGDLRKHVNMAFFKDVLAHLAKEPLDLIAFSNNPLDDRTTDQLRTLMTEWHDIAPLSDHDAARLIRERQIDILMDLSGHTAHNRLPVFAWRPAPVQATWLGFAATTGLAEMDYLLADAVSVPQASQAHYSERILYLPETRLCMTPPGAPEQWPISPLPALGRGFITFGSFQQVGKINNGVLAAWSKILARVPGSRLRLQIRYLDVPSVREDLQRRLQLCGIAADRVSLHEGTSADHYLAAHHEVDLILDTFPYPGGTTTAEALWMGVPTLTLQGESLLARQGASMLSCAGLPQWIAGDASDYVKRAVRLAADIPALANLRQELRANVLASPLFDSPRFARHLVAAFQVMHQNAVPPGPAPP